MLCLYDCCWASRFQRIICHNPKVSLLCDNHQLKHHHFICGAKICFFPQVYHFIFTSNDLHLLFYLPDIQFNKVLWQILSVGAILVTLIYLLVSQQQIAHFFSPIWFVNILKNLHWIKVLQTSSCMLFNQVFIDVSFTTATLAFSKASCTYLFIHWFYYPFSFH